VLGTVGLELYRGIRARRRQYGESLSAAAFSLVWRNKRRWGGYIVHVGVVVAFFGIAGSAAYQNEAVETLAPGGTLEVDGYAMRYEGYRLEAVDDHIGAITDLSVWQDGRLVARLAAEATIPPQHGLSGATERVPPGEGLPRGDPETHQADVAGIYGLIRDLEGRAGREVKTPSTEVAIHASLSPSPRPDSERIST